MWSLLKISIFVDSSSEDNKPETSVWTLFRVPLTFFVTCFGIPNSLTMSPPATESNKGTWMLRITSRHSCQGYIVDILRQIARNHPNDPNPPPQEQQIHRVWNKVCSWQRLTKQWLLILELVVTSRLIRSGQSWPPVYMNFGSKWCIVNGNILNCRY